MTLPDDAQVYLDGEAYTGDVAEIEIVMGEPPSVIPSEFPSGLTF